MKKTITISDFGFEDRDSEFIIYTNPQGLISLNVYSEAQGTHTVDLDVAEAAELISALGSAIKEAVQHD